MFISLAHAAGEVGTAAGPAAADTFWMNIGLIGLMFVLFYLLLIRPQQKRLKEQRAMLDTLKKGDEVITAGGLVGVVSKVLTDTEVEIEIAKGVTVTALRYTIQMKTDEQVSAPKSSQKAEKVVVEKEVVEKPAKKTPAKTAKAKPKAKTTTTTKKTTTKK